MAAERAHQKSRRAAYLGLSTAFLGLLTLFTESERRQGEELKLTPFDLAQLGLATYRGGRMIAYDNVAQPWREPFTQTKPDSSGAGDTTVPRGNGVQRSIGELLSCPICVGTWFGASMVYGLRLAPRSTRALMAILSTAGIVELLNALTEALTWSGQEARDRAGAEYHRDKVP